MAGDWIKMRTDLFTHPKVVRIASALKADRLRTVGGLMSVWCLFDAHSVDGQLEGYTLSTLDELVGWSGFSAAVQSVGWLEETEQGLALPDFEHHNGQSAKRRAQDADRKREDRASASEADKKRTREEKRREEDKNQNQKQKTTRVAALSSSDLVAEGVDEETAVEFLALRTKKRAPLTPKAWEGIKDEAGKAGWSLQDAIAKCLARGWQGFEAAWVKSEFQPARASPQAKFDPVAYVNRNRQSPSNDQPDSIIDVEAKPVA